MTEKLALPETTSQLVGSGFVVMKQFMIDMFGPVYLERCLQVCKREFARVGALTWEPQDANTVIDVCPMPAPWEGQWGFRIRFAVSLGGAGDIHVNQFYVPASTIPQFRKGDLSGLN